MNGVIRLVFSDIKFLYLFLPAFLAVYYIVPARFRNHVLLGGSIIFYGIGSVDHPLYAVLLVLNTVLTWYAALRMKKGAAHRKAWLTGALILLFGQVFLFKYEAFLSGAIASLFGRTILPSLSLALPIGISFYVFQAASYLIDVYREKYVPAPSLLRFGTYLTMFSQVTSGPIVTYDAIRPGLKSRKLTFADFAEGLRWFILGLAFKVLLANNIGGLWRDAQNAGYESISFAMSWLGVIGYSLQLYFDFWGYSLMAQGIGRILGFRIPDNFLHPYACVSMTEFWRRWHVTLGAWFRNYVYIPLGGNRRGKFRTILNLLVVWLLTGLWHGASYNFLLWGLILFFILVIEKTYLKDILDSHKLFGHIYMILLIPLTWAVFAETDLSRLSVLMDRLFLLRAGSYQALVKGDWLKALGQYWWLLLICIGLCFEKPMELFKKYKNSIFVTLLLAAALALSVYCINMGLNDPFMYFKF